MKGPDYSAQYLSAERWTSFVHQIAAIMPVAPQSVIEIGIGPGVKEGMVKATFPGCSYVGVDIDPELKPHVQADVRALPFEDNQFDAAFCCQVLEHIPYEDFLAGLGELRRVTRKRVVISVPDVRPFVYLRARPPASRRILPWLWRGVSFSHVFPQPIRFEDHGQHYWEIGRRDYPFRRVLQDIKSLGWSNVQHYRMVDRH
ncbi:MAG: methyltransferase domain-containing protein, partial [Pseudomonadota bacterium]